MSQSLAWVGVDVGGTFTDFACTMADGRQIVFKVASSPDDPSRAVIEGLRWLVRHHGIAASDISVFAHGTTVATNAVLERKGATVGLITTQGFRDILEIGRQMRRQMYSVRLEPETPVFLAPGARRLGVVERVGSSGEILTPLDEEDVVAVIKELRGRGATSLAVSLLFSFLNPDHERRIRAIVDEHWPEMPVSLSSEIDPVFREYERTVVTAFDAYIKPTVTAYLERLAAALAAEGVVAPLQVMQSRGGLAGAATATRRPVRLFLSGPAGGVIGALDEGSASGLKDLITVDIGGTSCDIALVSGSKPLVRQEGVIDGYMVRVPMVDVNAIGAGGGSIAWLDTAGSLKVGPHSAGSDPGPACYDRGGVEATVTDASIALGLIDPDYFAGGTLSLKPKLSHSVIRDKIADPLGLSVEAAALGIHRVLTAQMAEGIRLVSIKQGFDPRDFTLVALGGAGPLSGCALADELSMRIVLVPRYPGVLSASGLLAAPVEHEISASFSRPLCGLALNEVRTALDRLDYLAGELITSEKLGSREVEVAYSADVCYIGQGYHLEVPLDFTGADPLGQVYRDFLVLHDRIFGHAVDNPARVVNLRTVHRAAPEIRKAARGVTHGDPQKSVRQVVIDGAGTTVKVPILNRQRMGPGLKLVGPVIVEQNDTTVWVPQGWHGHVLESLALLLEREEGT